MRVCSIDPGRRSLAWAGWYNSYLIGCALAKVPGDCRDETGNLAILLADQLPQDMDEVVVEGMVVQRERTRDPRDMMDLQAIGCFAAGQMRPRKLTITDGTMWKNNLSKEHQHRLDERALFPGELRILYTALRKHPHGLQHNIRDAVGIGLWYLRKKRRHLTPVL